MRKLLKQERGLTLVEILVSLAIVSIILLVVSFILLQIIQTNKTSKEIVAATYLAQSEMEKLYSISREGDFDNWMQQVQAEVTSYDYDDPTYTLVYDAENDNDFVIQLNISHLDPPPLKRIKITVLLKKSPDTERAKMENIIEWGSSHD